MKLNLILYEICIKPNFNNNNLYSNKFKKLQEKIAPFIKHRKFKRYLTAEKWLRRQAYFMNYKKKKKI